MTPWLRRLHKWLGLLIGAQFLLWMASGVVMSLLDSKKVAGSLSRMPKLASPMWPHDVTPVDAILARQHGPVRSLATGWLFGKPVYQLSNSQGTRLLDARTGRAIVIDAPLARSLALASYAGTGDPAVPRLLKRSSEVRKHKGPVWAVDFSDGDATAVYVSAETGAIIAHRNSTWRLFDFFWMLHIMDYSEREDFNHPLLIGAGIGGLWLALSGLWLLVTSLHLAEFIPARMRGAHTLRLVSDTGAHLFQIEGSAGNTVYAALSKKGIDLPSQCGGGQSCGLCAVRVCGPIPPPSSGDKAHLDPDKLARGYRLACGIGIKSDMALEIPEAAISGSAFAAMVEGIKDVTPTMRELTLRIDEGMGKRFWPGAYVQILIPPYDTNVAALEVPGLHSVSAIPIDTRISSNAALRRSYSLSTPMSNHSRTLTLLVRLMRGQGTGAAHFGAGSAYMFSLRTGDRVALAGPFGDFAIRQSARETVFIGGGAGMAPLRAMIHELLDEGSAAPVYFWYGARTVAEAPYLEEMLQLAQRHANFSWQLVVSNQPEGVEGALSGLVHERARELLLGKRLDPTACEFYVCGPPAMLEAARQMLAELGVPPTQVSFDDFKI